MEKSGAKAYLVNTGWNGTGKRISIKDTRGIIDAILSGAINNAPTKTIPHFNFEVPTELPGVDPAILDPRDTYADASEWETKAQDLASADSLRTSQNTKATQLVRLWLLQVRRLNQPTLRKTRDFYPNIKKAVRSGFIPGGQPSSLSRMPRHSCCEMRVMQCMTYFFCASLQSCRRLYQMGD